MPARLVVAVSGGMDSMVLLVLVRELALARGLPVMAVHVHHGLSPQADAWARRVEAVCTGLGVSCMVSHVEVDRGQASLEGAARDARHAALAAALSAGDVLCLAHHADDQAETLLLRLLRGSGLSGLGAMRERRAVPGTESAWLLRPWLAEPRVKLAAEAAARGLAWCEDESNADTRFDRNFLRLQVLPLLAARWPAINRVLPRTARQLAEASQLLDEYLDADLAPLLGPGALPTLATGGLLRHTPARQRALLQRWLVRIGAGPFQERWLEALRGLAFARVDAEGELLVAGWELHRYRGCLHAFPALPPVVAAGPVNWDLCGELDLGPALGCLRALPADAGAGLPLALLPGTPVALRLRAGGERLRPNGRSGERPLKKILQEQGVPPWLRQRLPLLYREGRLVAVADRIADVSVVPTADRPASLCLLWEPPAGAFDGA